LVRAKEIVGDFEGVISASVKSAFDDDLAVPQVLALISEALRRGNTAISDGAQEIIKTAAAEIRGALAILGCDPFDAAFNAGGKDLSDALDGVIQLALAQRAAARDRKDFAASDAIRDGLAALGISIEDTPQGQRWTIKG
jgi:cysteinyl-tRNA synthetase